MAGKLVPCKACGQEIAKGVKNVLTAVKINVTFLCDIKSLRLFSQLLSSLLSVI